MPIIELYIKNVQLYLSVEGDPAPLVGVEVGVPAEEHPEFSVPDELALVEAERFPGVEVV
jgi:hypothetical protein